MKIPQGISGSSSGDFAHLRRSLYGLKQAPTTWLEKF